MLWLRNNKIIVLAKALNLSYLRTKADKEQMSKVVTGGLRVKVDCKLIKCRAQTSLAFNSFKKIHADEYSSGSQKD